LDLTAGGSHAIRVPKCANLEKTREVFENKGRNHLARETKIFQNCAIGGAMAQ
jgi:hypothetical protein